MESGGDTSLCAIKLATRSSPNWLKGEDGRSYSKTARPCSSSHVPMLPPEVLASLPNHEQLIPLLLQHDVVRFPD
jgi:hypothetical protein